MDVVRQFVENYKKKYAFYENAARLAASQLDMALQAAGIRAIVTSRAKNPVRLWNKVSQRNEERPRPYKTMKEIYEDIVDLSGVRISLYFPGDREKTDALIHEMFDVLECKQFPEQLRHPSYEKRFSGYWGNHYRTHMKEDHLTPPQKKYIRAKIEIQVASVLMHAWSEVEHDLIYKPLQGTLSQEEFSILDELNGLVMAGEIALERLQSAGNQRIQNKNTTFGSQYDLASYLYNFISLNFENEDAELKLGNVELLYRLLTSLNILRVREIEPILKSVQFERDKRNISQQIVDQIITGNEKRYRIYQELRAGEQVQDEKTAEAVRYFLKQWVPLEERLNRRAARENRQEAAVFNINEMKRTSQIDPELLNELAVLRRTRNVLIHEIEEPESEEIIRQGDRVRELAEKL